MQWDPKQYSAYAGERERPFADLLARIPHPAPRRVVDVGCGTGTTTALLAEHWPAAVVEGFDSSPEMIDAAQPLATASLSFRVADAADWQLPDDADVIVSNAVLQWIPNHREMLAGWASQLRSGAWLGIQVPGNFGAPSHQLMRSIAASPRWRTQLDGVLRGDDSVATPEVYADILLRARLVVDVWETTYLHVLHGDDPVLEWVRGTGLRPVLGALSSAEAAEFEASYSAALREAYPAGVGGTVFPFRRIFAVAHRA
jgi:trans-aconitate 2-methyltransferase